jgi:protein gp37
MSAGTPIQWCDDTCNPTSGCDGCELFRPLDPDKATCYARVVHLQRLTKAPALKATGYYAPAFSEVRMIPGRMEAAARHKDLRGTWRDHKPWLDGLPRCIFVGDLSDVMSLGVSDHFIETQIFQPMESERGRRHIWMLLTKRPARLAELSIERGGLPDNCIAMTSITNQRTAETRLPHLMRVRAACRGVSAEPLLGPVDLRPWLWAGDAPGLDWIIVGGESGPNARRASIAWIRDIVAQARTSPHAALFVKQLGRLPWLTLNGVGNPPIEGRLALKDDKGGDWLEWPDDLRIREMPEHCAWVAGGAS